MTELKFTREQVEAEFLSLIARSMPVEELTSAFAEKHYAWFYSACTLFGKNNNDWYSALEALYSGHGGLSVEVARKRVEEIREAGKRSRVAAASAAHLKFSRDDVVREFLVVMGKSVEELTYAFAEKHYAWFYSACTLFGKNNNDWYGALEALYSGHGGLSVEVARKRVEEIREAGKRSRVAAASAAHLKFSRDDVVREFLVVMGKSVEELTLAFAEKHYAWFSSARTLFGKNKHDWYSALEALYSGHGGLSVEVARKRVEEIRVAGKRSNAAATRVRSLKFSRNEVIHEFLSVIARSVPVGELTHAFAVKHYAWFYSACTLFSKNKSDWYGALEALYSGHGGLSAEAARERIAEIRRAGAAASRSRVSGSGVVVVDSVSVGNGCGVDFGLARGVFGELGVEGVASVQVPSSGQARLVLEVERGGGAPSDAQRLRFGIGAANARGDWGALAREYVDVFSRTAPFVRDRALAVFVAKLASEGRIEVPGSILSQASGPGQLFDAVQDVKPVFEAVGRVPVVTDLDCSSEMLGLSKNPLQVLARVHESGSPARSFDGVENSSIYQFKAHEAKSALLEASRVTRMGGLLVLSTMGKRFSDEFREGVELLGYELVTLPNERLSLSERMICELSKRFGEDFARKAKEAAEQCYVLVARKVAEPQANVSAVYFSFEKKTREQVEAVQVGMAYRRMWHALDRQAELSEAPNTPETEREFTAASKRSTEAINAFHGRVLGTGFHLRHAKAHDRLSVNLEARLRAWRERVNRAPAERQVARA